MGFKKRANARRAKAKKDTVTKLNRVITDEEERVVFLLEQLHTYNDNVRGFNGNAGSCITDSMLFVKVWNRLGWGKAEPVCTDLASQSSQGMQVVLWHKGHDGDDPHYPEPRTNPRYYDPNGMTGYDGHIIVKTPNFYVDPTIGQISRHNLFAPLSIHFPATLADALTEYPPQIQDIFTRTTPVELRLRKQGDVGTDKEQQPIIHREMQDLVLFKEASLAPKKVAILPYEVGDHMTLLGWAIRTDIDFETELAEHRKFWPDNDTWWLERKIHGRGLYAQVINTLTQLQKGVNK